jgi:hypothetical protein
MGRNALLRRRLPTPRSARSVTNTGKRDASLARARWCTLRRPGPGFRPAPGRVPPCCRKDRGSCIVLQAPILIRADISTWTAARQSISRGSVVEWVVKLPSGHTRDRERYVCPAAKDARPPWGARATAPSHGPRCLPPRLQADRTPSRVLVLLLVLLLDHDNGAPSNGTIGLTARRRARARAHPLAPAQRRFLAALRDAWRRWRVASAWGPRGSCARAASKCGTASAWAPRLASMLPRR